jgi:hypothetical protein
LHDRLANFTMTAHEILPADLIPAIVDARWPNRNSTPESTRIMSVAAGQDLTLLRRSSHAHTL